MSWPEFPPKPHESPDCECSNCHTWSLFPCLKCGIVHPGRHKAHRCVRQPSIDMPAALGWICDGCYATFAKGSA